MHDCTVENFGSCISNQLHCPAMHTLTNRVITVFIRHPFLVFECELHRGLPGCVWCHPNTKVFIWPPPVITTLVVVSCLWPTLIHTLGVCRREPGELSSVVQVFTVLLRIWLRYRVFFAVLRSKHTAKHVCYPLKVGHTVRLYTRSVSARNHAISVSGIFCREAVSGATR